MIKFIRHIGFFPLLLVLTALMPIRGLSQTIEKGNVTIAYDQLDDGTIKIRYVENKSSQRITIFIDGNEGPAVNANSSVQIPKIAYKSLRYNSKNSGATLWTFTAPSEQVSTAEDSTPVESMESVEATGANHIPTAKAAKRDRVPSASAENPTERINEDPFFGLEAVNSFVKQCSSFEKGLSTTNDKRQFIIDNDLEAFLLESELELDLKKNEIPTLAQDIISTLKVSDTSNIINLVVETLNNRLSQRQQAFSSLKTAVDTIPDSTQSAHSFQENIINYCIVAGIVVVLIILTIVIIKKKKAGKAKSGKASVKTQEHTDDANPAIVVRRRTTSIMKRQSLEDVVGNPAYMVINSSEFTPDSAVRNIYIKNSCIKEVYNLYAEDLRNSESPNEDGCMVLGRWVRDENNQTYDISLETVVFPGDDAVFKEYELNFGGKIKLRIAEKLRKLRRDTNLQYDLVCWIHSHPGLGVFFSNSDDNVQNQLKHAQHPNFLIAFVIDILTEDQKTGIFTFRKDGSMNSKGDLIKMYSLEEMYKWALESDKASFSQENYYNILKGAKVKLPTCKGIELNNSSIIDLTQLLAEPNIGLIGWAVGTSIDTKEGKEIVISSLVKADEKPAVGIEGAVISVPHVSLPTIQRFISGQNAQLSFVLVYSSKLMTLTSIPVVNGELITDEQFYGDENIDDLKIWTRRKR